jgi:hypothetical protein
MNVLDFIECCKICLRRKICHLQGCFLDEKEQEGREMYYCKKLSRQLTPEELRDHSCLCLKRKNRNRHTGKVGTYRCRCW